VMTMIPEERTRAEEEADDPQRHQDEDVVAEEWSCCGGCGPASVQSPGAEKVSVISLHGMQEGKTCPVMSHCRKARQAMCTTSFK